MKTPRRSILEIAIPEDDRQMQYEVPGVIPHWLERNPERREELALKLQVLADACSKKEWPFEQKIPKVLKGKYGSKSTSVVNHPHVLTYLSESRRIFLANHKAKFEKMLGKPQGCITGEYRNYYWILEFLGSKFYLFSGKRGTSLEYCNKNDLILSESNWETDDIARTAINLIDYFESELDPERARQKDLMYGDR